jgi:NTE family protein
MDIPSQNRAITFQGYGLLGAYEVGVFKTLNEIIFNENKKTGAQNRGVFDIVIGTGMGAVNAAIIV